VSRVPFSQTFVGTVLAAVAAGLILWFLTRESQSPNAPEQPIEQTQKAPGPVEETKETRPPKQAPPADPPSDRGSGQPSLPSSQALTVARQPARYVVAQAVRSGDPLVLITDGSTELQPEMTATVARHIGGNAGAFTRAFILEGAFLRAYDGDPSDLETIDQIQRVPLIILGRTEATHSANDGITPGLRNADVRLTMRLYRPTKGFEPQFLHLTAVGAGFTDQEAFSNAAQRLAQQVREALR
jgi:hypothetical protein